MRMLVCSPDFLCLSLSTSTNASSTRSNIMSVAHTNKRNPSYQPYHCPICQSRFTRHENLKRHAKLHSRSQEETSFPCVFCQATFSRSDLRHRHMKKKHPEHEQRRVPKTSLRRPLKQRNAEWRTQQPEFYLSSESSPDSQDGLYNQDIGDCYHADNDATWHRPSENVQRSPHHNDYMETAGVHRNPSTRDDTNDIHHTRDRETPQSPYNESGSIERMVQDAMEVEQSLLQGTPFLKPNYNLDNQLQSAIVAQSAPFEQNLVDCSFPQSLPNTPQSNIQDDWLPSPAQVKHGCELFFAHISHFVPFIHQQTFNTSQLPLYLVLSILCLGYQYGEDPECADPISSGESLSIRCFDRARALVVADEERPDHSMPDLPLVQSCLLLQICAMMYICGRRSRYGLKMHSDMISIARTEGLMQPMEPFSSATEDLDALWREFIRAESHKRTSFAVHQIDALWYQFLSIPRSISHLEVKHDLPCPEDQWTASSAAEWAHRQLVRRHSGPAVAYPDAVRQFLSSETTLNSIPMFDPYGAINIAQFLISSAREVSGWSAMTGMLSMDRLNALRSSLIALGPFIRPKPETPRGTHAAATWETAMIELHLWSPAHTGGIVAASLDAVLTQSTSLAPSYEFLWEADTATAIQPHVDWFLRYLDTTLDPSLEAPWTAVYAYKAFLIAWQLVRGSIPGAMQVVGILDGDVEGALAWARQVFQRRQQWTLGKLILSCLDELGH
ncbi:fungal-specific transcription factor domain-containing protein [Aspergillus avenaceus]|uniref:Fungal-specific transcription factor domain-containing protein n=1 Tax=Aspergillus avenaceus TaxID=36643 RepID=A0A5N6U690_ASPAV|nr:fungal-specific transcription factor domain-containing protein [Aspergillus avenaceus]